MDVNSSKIADISFTTAIDSIIQKVQFGENMMQNLPKNFKICEAASKVI